MIDILTNESFLFLLALSIIAALGMNIVYSTGQLNLGQAGFMAVGAYSAAVTDNVFGWPFVASLAAGALAAGLVALPVAWGANRIRGVYLIMGTLAVGELVRITIGNVDSIGGLQGYFGITPATLTQVTAVLITVIVFTAALMSSSLGLRMRAIFDDEDASAAAGVPTRSVKITSVVISAAIVGLAGGVMAKWLLFIAPHNFDLDLSFRIALFTLIGGVHSVLGAIFGAFFVTYLLELLRVLGGSEATPTWLQFIGPWRQVIYGIFIMVLMAVKPEGIISRQLDLAITRPLRKLRRKSRHSRKEDTSSKSQANRPLSSGVKKTDDREAVRKPILRVDELSHRFNGIVALSHVSLVVNESEILALIGANGAGKTTIINVVSGRYHLQDGSIRLLDSDLKSLSADKRVKAGISRTFQSVRMFAHLTVEENLHLGQMASGDRKTPSIEELVELLGLEGKLDSLPDSLTLAEQRKLEIGRAIASSPVVVFLDEPSVGMNELERTELASLIKNVRGRGTAVVLIDHNLDLAFTLADRVAVLDFGKLLAEGMPSEIINDPQVRQAYLGRTEVVL